MMLMCFPALAASISRESTRPGVDAGTVSLTDATGTGADPGACRHKVELAVVELGGCMAGTDAGADVDSDGPGHRGWMPTHVHAQWNWQLWRWSQWGQVMVAVSVALVVVHLPRKNPP